MTVEAVLLDCMSRGLPRRIRRMITSEETQVPVPSIPLAPTRRTCCCSCVGVAWSSKSDSNCSSSSKRRNSSGSSSSQQKQQQRQYRKPPPADRSAISFGVWDAGGPLRGSEGTDASPGDAAVEAFAILDQQMNQTSGSGRRPRTGRGGEAAAASSSSAIVGDRQGQCDWTSVKKAATKAATKAVATVTVTVADVAR